MTVELLFQTLLVVASLVGIGCCHLLVRTIGKEKAEKINEELINKKEIVKISVLFVQKVYENYNGPVKYDLAVDYIQKQFKKIGLSVDDIEIKAMIEGTLKEFKKEFGETWKENIDK